MSAIAGCVSAGSVSAELCARIIDAQRPYGEINRPAVSLGGATFAAALHALLPEDSFDKQPLVAGERLLLAADTRIDNREELLHALGLEGSSVADSDIVLGAWLRWGAACFTRLAGAFAAAIWDAGERRLVLARDPTGQRPLFYAAHDDLIAFSTMPSGLLAVPQLRRGFNFERLATAAAGIVDASDASYFSGIHKVRPGCLVSIGPDGISESRHWAPPADELRLSTESYVDRYHELLETAVRENMRRASGSLAVHLSSGFDSGAVAATAARVSAADKPIAYTAAPRNGFDGPVPRNRIADESGPAAQTAAKHGLQHIVIRSDADVFSSIREHCRLYQEPRCDIVNIGWVRTIFSDAKQRGVSTLLTGEMGNLTIHAGGLPVLAEWVRRHAFRAWWSEARAASRNPAASWKGIIYNSFGERLPDGLQRLLTRYFVGVPLPSDSFVRREWLNMTARARDQRATDYSGRYSSRFRQIEAYDIGLFRKGALAEFGLEERDPTADRRLLDFSFALPPEQLLHDGVWRPLARKALADLLPSEVLNSSLRGYQGADWYERLRPQTVRPLLEEVRSSHAAREFLDLDRIADAIDRWPNGGWNETAKYSIYRARLPIALMIGAFLQEFEPLSTS